MCIHCTFLTAKIFVKLNSVNSQILKLHLSLEDSCAGKIEGNEKPTQILDYISFSIEIKLASSKENGMHKYHKYHKLLIAGFKIAVNCTSI